LRRVAPQQRLRRVRKAGICQKALLQTRKSPRFAPHAGTTRDVIEVQLDLDYPVTVIDTAGIRGTDDGVEQEGVRRARARVSEADPAGLRSRSLVQRSNLVFLVLHRDAGNVGAPQRPAHCFRLVAV
jgi:hypothetical protein